jgi:FkbM family methyltransferase
MKPPPIRRILRGIVHRLGYCASLIRLVVGSITQLKNWRELLQGTLKEMLGAAVLDIPILCFRSGLQIEMAAGGYAGFYVLFAEIFIDRCYRPTRQFVVGNGWTVVDIGANVGFFTCQAATAAKRVRVVAVEPVSAYVKVLRQNVERNALHNVNVLPVAVSCESGRKVGISVWYTPSGEPKTHYPIPPNVRRETETVMGMTLAEIFEAALVDRCDLLKIDIEGAEYELFEGTSPEIWSRIERVVMETHQVAGRTQRELVKALSDQGFETRVSRNLLWATRGKSTKLTSRLLPS